ncbi:hypothetical protein [Noviherbaspirillum sp.]|uniref:hypothetical protein n=1 Tax=Noviherbaspirillum sp. TaxID=1926288 RepID=UPI002DDD9CAA|nr:hypothetical protein [Noviherbaspirillum sp.]
MSALLLAAYACIHITNHLVGVAGVDAHIAFMRALRSVYRIPVVEAVLFAAVSFQVCSGLYFVVRGWRKRQGAVAWLQAGSGAYLAFFLLNHAGAVLFGRAVLNLDTNFHFAAAGFHVPPFQLFFAPYYFLGVTCLFVHLGCALHWHLKEKAARLFAVGMSIVVGSVVSLLIVLTLAGAFYPVQIPPEYKATYGGNR